MADKSDAQQPPSLILSPGTPLVGVMEWHDGKLVERIYAGWPNRDSQQANKSLEAALSVIGAWSDLDWDEFSKELEEIRQAGKPTPPNG